ncbi:MAG TPA: hypothetical protein VH253_01605 [Phycisphaerae bacterium]|nr:hypothetical protein [Phycisphaerae bacterium]
MTTIAEIEQAITRLAPEDFRVLREWIAQRDAQLWDQQFESDAHAGRLDALAQEALDELHRGQCKDL